MKAKNAHLISRIPCFGVSALAFAFLLLAMCSTHAVAAGPCPNESIREAQTSEALPQSSTYLPACMALEMVSPPKKFGQEAGELSAFSPDGNRALFKSKAALADTEGQHTFIGDNYVATRGIEGWVASATSAPRSAKIAGGGNLAGGPYAFTLDLTSWALVGCTQAQMLAGESQIFTSGLDGAFNSLSPLMQPIAGGDEADILFTSCSGLNPSGTSADRSAAVFAAWFSRAYLPEDPRGEGGTDATNSYVVFLDEDEQPTLELLARDKDGEVFGGRCGSHLGGGSIIQGAISEDGSRIYFTTRPAQAWNEETVEGPPCSTSNPLRIMKRLETPAGAEVSELIPGGPVQGSDLYQGASVDGSKVLLATPRKLTASDQDVSAEACGDTLGSSKGCDLYLHDSTQPPGEQLIQISAGGPGDPDPGKGADVLTSIAALSPDGSHVYFAAQGILTNDPNPEGDTAQAGQPNLYLYQRDQAHPSGRTVFIGTLASGDKGQLWGVLNSLLAGAYRVPLHGDGDGHILLFLSRAPLTDSDADGNRADIFRYESQAPELLCISCAPGGPDSAPFDVNVAGSREPFSSNFAEIGRWASEDGETVAFATAQPLASDDEDGGQTSYLWKDGELARLPDEANASQEPPIVSPDGDQVGFSITAPLLPQDGDTARDAYVVRADGGFPIPPPPTVCDPLSEGSCQGAAGSAPLIPAAASSTFTGPGDPTPTRCRKGRIRRGGKCLKPRRKARKQAAKQKRSSHKPGGSK